jgi:hypothetical protein
LPQRWNLLAVTCQDGTQQGIVNGVFKGATHFTFNTRDVEVELGARFARGGAWWQSASCDGDFAELLIYNRALDAGEQQKVESYLSRKWFAGRIVPVDDPLVWRNPQKIGISSLSFSPATGHLLAAIDNGTEKGIYKCDDSGNWSRVMPANNVCQIQWSGPASFVYSRSQTLREQIVRVDLQGVERFRLFKYPDADIHWFSLNSGGDKLFLLGAISNEPSAGIWQYDLQNHRLQPVGRNQSGTLAWTDSPQSKPPSRFLQVASFSTAPKNSDQCR